MKRLLASPARNLLLGVIYMMLVMLAATAAYVAAGWSLGDAIYMVVLTVYTVGYDEVHAVDSAALRAITIGLIVLGCTGMIFLTGALVQFITIGQLQLVLGLKRMQGQIDRLTDHVIVCGFGRIGVLLARELYAGQSPFVVLERNEQRLEQARALGYLCLQADATDEAALRTAGIERARCLASVLPDDAANVFITLSARGLNPRLSIIARGEMPSTESKLLRAGANQVVLPTHIGAERIAELILFPDAARLLHGSIRKEDFARDLRMLGLELEVVVAAEGSRCVGQSIAAIEQSAEGAFWVVGLERRDGESLVRPPGDELVKAGDGVMLIGRPGRALALEGMFEKSWQRAARG